MSASTSSWSRTGGLGRRGKLFSLFVGVVACCGIAFAPSASAEYTNPHWMQTTGESAGSPVGWGQGNGVAFEVSEAHLAWYAAGFNPWLRVGFAGELWNDAGNERGTGEVSTAEVLDGGITGFSNCHPTGTTNQGWDVNLSAPNKVEVSGLEIEITYAGGACPLQATHTIYATLVGEIENVYEGGAVVGSEITTLPGTVYYKGAPNSPLNLYASYLNPLGVGVLF